MGLRVAAALMAGLTAACITTYLNYGHEPHVDDPAPYEHEPPRPLPPAVVPAILTQTRVRHSGLAKRFAATLLEIEERQNQGVLAPVCSKTLI